MKTRSWWALGLGGAIVALLIWVALRPSAVPVDVVEIRRDTLSITVEEEGRTRAQELFRVAAPVTGRLSRPTLEEGTVVARGDVLVTLRPAPDDPRVQAAREAAVESARARLARAEAEQAEAADHAEQAQREVERRRPLLEMGALAAESMERFEEAARSARVAAEAGDAAVRAARADLEQARAALLGAGADSLAPGALLSVRAPVAGTVLRVLEESERVVAAGTPLVELADPAALEVTADLLTEEAVRVAPGNPMLITGWGGGRTLHGSVRRVEPSAFTEISTLGVEEQRVRVVGTLPDPPPELGVGFRLEVSVVVWRGTEVLAVPASALFRRDGRWHLFRVVDGRAVLTGVEVGEQGSGRAEITSGLAEGDRVIPFPSDLVGDGVRVRAVGASSGGEGGGA